MMTNIVKPSATFAGPLHMTRTIALFALVPLGACSAPMMGAGDVSPAAKVPAEVAALAAHQQNLQEVRLLDDGCYWYRHDGPVESTMLPLRTASGSPICVRRDSAPASAG